MALRVADWSFSPADEVAARGIVAWRYQSPYDFYNLVEADVASLLDPALHYFAATAPSGELQGFCCFGADATVPGGAYPADGALDVGIGLRPDLTGRGRGAAFLEAVLAFGEQRFSPAAFRTTVAAFNGRSLRTCERAGFVPAGTFGRTSDGVPFLILRRG